MTGQAEVDRLRQQLDATFKRVTELNSLDVSLEVLSDYARYLCVLTSGYLEKAVVEHILEYVRNHSDGRIQKHIEQRLRQLTNLKTERLIQTVGNFDPEWRIVMETLLVDEYKDALDSVVNLRNNISHGQQVTVTISRITEYYGRIKVVVDRVGQLCH